MKIGLLSSPPCNHPGESTNTLRFGGGYETGDYEREMTVTLCHCGPPGAGAHNLSWNREECPFLTTLYALWIHTRRILDRHDYTHSVELASSTHPLICSSVCLSGNSNRKSYHNLGVSIQNVVVGI